MEDKYDEKTHVARSRPVSPVNKGIIMSDTDEEIPLTPMELPGAKALKSPKGVRFREQEQDEAAPVKPPRPLSPQQQALITLIEAFPSIDGKVVKAVLAASGGQMEPAFNALLGMSDPDFQEEQPPPRPPRPVQQDNQISQDEMYARQLASHYQSGNNHQQKQRQPRSQEQRPMGERTVRSGGSSEDREYSFFDDDLPAIRENVRQGFIQTQSTVNKWITDLRKRIDGEDEDDLTAAHPAGAQQPQRQNYGASQTNQMRGIRKSAEAAATRQGRRSTEYERYDADPRVLSDNFSELELKDEETPPPKPNRPLANPALFRPGNSTTTMNPPQSGPVDEVDALYHQSTPSGGNSGKGNKKWQPLTSTTTNPEVAGDVALDEDEDNDPFSLGDNSEDDKEGDINKEATARLKSAAAKKDKGKGRAGSEVENKSLEENERAGSTSVRDKDAEDILKG